MRHVATYATIYEAIRRIEAKWSVNHFIPSNDAKINYITCLCKQNDLYDDIMLFIITKYKSNL